MRITGYFESTCTRIPVDAIQHPFPKRDRQFHPALRFECALRHAASRALRRLWRIVGSGATIRELYDIQSIICYVWSIDFDIYYRKPYYNLLSERKFEGSTGEWANRAR